MDELSPDAHRLVTTASALILRAAKCLVSDSQALQANVVVRNGKATLILTASEMDIKWLVGRNGRMAEALRTLTNALTLRGKVRLSVLIQTIDAEFADVELPRLDCKR